MESKSFCYWLQGFFEINNLNNDNDDGLNALQVQCIEKHLALVFKHEIDPSMGDEKHQNELNKIHNSGHPDYDLPDKKKVVMRC